MWIISKNKIETQLKTSRQWEKLLIMNYDLKMSHESAVVTGTWKCIYLRDRAINCSHKLKLLQYCHV